ncbi:MAG: hypothetical protein VKK04_25275 [Synechococcales bacterium]|nr:hypothetical protein [Synechococcales bacterium]
MTTNQYLNFRKSGIRLGAIALGLVALVLPACENPNEISEGQDNVTAEDVVGGTEEGGEGGDGTAVGELVTVRSPIANTLDDQGVVLESEAGNLLVLNPTNVPFPTPEDEEIPVQVTGEVVDFVIVDVENEFGLDLNDELYGEYEQQPVIIAESFAPAPRPEDLAESGDRFYDQPIAVEGVVGGILSSNSFVLYEEGWVDDVGLLVVGVPQDLESPDSDVNDGEMVTVTGVAQPFDINSIQESYDTGWDENEINEFETRYTDRPVIIADEVYPSALDD